MGSFHIDDLEDIKVGDKVIIKTSGNTPYVIRHVERTTATQFTTNGNGRYLKRNGERVGNGVYSVRAYRYTDERWAEAEQIMESIKQQDAQRSLRAHIAATHWGQLPVEQIVQIADILGIPHDVELEELD